MYYKGHYLHLVGKPQGWLVTIWNGNGSTQNTLTTKYERTKNEAYRRAKELVDDNIPNRQTK